MGKTTNNIDKEIFQYGLPWKISLLPVALSAVGAILLGARFYAVRELLVFLIALVVLFAVGTGALLLLVLLQEGARWSIHQAIGGDHGAVSFQEGQVFRAQSCIGRIDVHDGMGGHLSGGEVGAIPDSISR